jgi:hypothetical protein
MTLEEISNMSQELNQAVKDLMRQVKNHNEWLGVLSRIPEKTRQFYHRDHVGSAYAAKCYSCGGTHPKHEPLKHTYSKVQCPVGMMEISKESL